MSVEHSITHWLSLFFETIHVKDVLPKVVKRDLTTTLFYDQISFVSQCWS